jgi:hypothetical protein
MSRADSPVQRDYNWASHALLVISGKFRINDQASGFIMFFKEQKQHFNDIFPGFFNQSFLTKSHCESGWDPLLVFILLMQKKNFSP